ncbi:MAG: non-canonical purine NTP pyrophosphatase, partial [Candidatus Micrarchaeia archaeon]
KHFLEKIGVGKLHLLLAGFKNKKAKMICYIGYCEPGKEPIIFRGVTVGNIVKARGSRCFGFDPIFQPKGNRKTQAEMSWNEKKKVSARTKALRKLANYLKK